MKEKIRAHIFISGRVQGVYFRQKTAKQAQVLGVSGWVRNLNNDKVEAVLEGAKKDVQKIIDWAKKGPFFARVLSLDIKWQKYKGEFNNFEIKH
jgi:acylphosphatase